MSVALPNVVRPPAFQALVLVAITALTSGCGADPATTVRALGSWASTAAMVGKAWADGATPRAYTTRALDRAMREVDQQARDLGIAPAPVRTSVTPVSERVTASLRRMAEAVRSGERGTVQAMADTLAADARRLQKLADAAARPS
jgi:hypothetical protein